jgi:uncharacterized cupredoxin-like copper-binding protein
MVLKIANASTIAHELIVFHKVMPADWEDSVGRGARELKPGETVDLVLTGLDPGEYAMVCCRVDADSKPHCDKGERTEFSIN